MKMKLPMTIKVNPENHQDKIHYIQALLNDLPEDQHLEIKIEKAKSKRTLAQLNGLFGVWFKHISVETGYTIQEIHQMMKRQLLAQIYIEQPENALQEQWGELLAKYQEEGNQEMLLRQLNRISLSWIASAKQMIEYMQLIERFWITQEVYMPEIKKFKDIVDEEELSELRSKAKEALQAA